jgi:hypothetical protein
VLVVVGSREGKMAKKPRAKAKKPSARANLKNARVFVAALLAKDKMDDALKHPDVGRIFKKLDERDIAALTGIAKTAPADSPCHWSPPPGR